MNEKEKPLSPKERDRLVAEAMRITQSRADLLRRNDALLKELMQCERYRKRRKDKIK